MYSLVFENRMQSGAQAAPQSVEDPWNLTVIQVIVMSAGKPIPIVYM
jgi:hypothetical protein